MPDRRAFTPKDLLARVLVAGAAVSPDGETLVFVRRTIEKGKERSRLWRVSMDGGRPERLTNAAASDTAPVFSPDSRSLAFLSDRGSEEGKEKSQPFLLRLSGGEPEALATLPEGADSISWSPSGDALLATGASGVERFKVGKQKDPTARHIKESNWRYDGRGIRDQHTSAWTLSPRGGGKAFRVTDPGFDVAQAFWSPDGKRIGFLADVGYAGARSERHLAWSVPRTGKGKPRLIVAGFDGVVTAAAWGRGGFSFAGSRARWLAYRNLDLFIMDSSGLKQVLEGRDQTFWGGAWSETLPIDGSTGPLWIDAERLIVLAQTRGRCVPYLVSRDADVRPLLAPGGTTDVAAVATGGGRVSVIASVDGGAGEVYELGLDDGGLRKITRQTERWFGPFRRSPEEVFIKHPDGHEVQGWLTRATGAGRKRRPTILEIHGGPYDSAGAARSCEELALADAGFHVLAMNPRGSVGFGEEYAKALFGRWGEPDSSDLLASVDWLARKGLADRKRVGLLGLSYGGFMVHHLLGNYPGRFRAAVSENPYTEAIADIGAGDSGMDTDVEVGIGSFPEALDEWLATSPVLRINRNHAPLLLLQADDDLRCPPVHSEIAFTVLRGLGRTVEMVRYPGEHHIMVADGRPDRRVDRLERILDWFSRYL